MGLFAELKRRNVFRVAVIYVIVSWILMQVGDVMFPALLLPEWTATMLAAFLILGFPVALLFAWAYEITPAGIKRTEDVRPGESITDVTGRKIDFAIIGVLAVAVVLLAYQLWFQDEPGTRPVATIPGKSIAVLPFANRSASEENAEFFAAGVHDDLLTLLSNLGDLKVISRTSVERLDPAMTIPEIGELLGVATVLEGQVQRAGDQLRINAQLIDTVTEDHLWAKTYDRELSASNVFAVQSDIARTIADALHAQLSPADESSLARVPTENTEALNAYLTATQLLNQGSFESFDRAYDLFKQATDLDPGYAEAWAGMANATQQSFWTGAINQDEYFARARPAIEQAIELNDQLAMTQAQLGALKWREGDLAAGERAFKKALEINPNDAVSLLTYARFLRMNNRPAEAVPVLEDALQNNPLSIELLFEYGKVSMYIGEPEKNMEIGRRILELDPGNVYGLTALVQATIWMGRRDLMWTAYLEQMANDPGDYEMWAHFGVHLETVGEPEWADRYLERGLEIGPNEPVPLKCKAEVLSMRGQTDEAVAIARRALEDGLDSRWGSDDLFLRLVRDDALKTGDYGEALGWFRDRFPELFRDDLQITVGNVTPAADLALLLRHAGDKQAADALIDTALEWYRETQPPGVHGYVLTIVDVQLLTLKGDKEQALATLREAVDSGWRFAWHLDISNPNLDPLRDDPRFQAIVDEVEADLAAQGESIRALPHQGAADLRFDTP